MSIKVAKAPPGPGRLELGRTIPSLLDEAVRERPNERAFNQRDGKGGWRTWSVAEFAKQSEELALGLRGAGLEAGGATPCRPADRVQNRYQARIRLRGIAFTIFGRR